MTDLFDEVTMQAKRYELDPIRDLCADVEYENGKCKLRRRLDAECTDTYSRLRFGRKAFEMDSEHNFYEV